MTCDIHKLIGEVAARNHVRLEETDPIFAVSTINRLMLDEAFENLLARVRVAITEFESSARSVESQAGRHLAEQVRATAMAWKAEIARDIDLAGVRSAEMVDRINVAHSRPAMLRWGALGLFAGLLFFGCGVLFGVLIR